MIDLVSRCGVCASGLDSKRASEQGLVGWLAGWLAGCLVSGSVRVEARVGVRVGIWMRLLILLLTFIFRIVSLAVFLLSSRTLYSHPVRNA